MGKRLPIDPKRLARGLYWSQAWSLISGCTPVDATCKNCWAATQAHMKACQKSAAIRARYGGLTKAVAGGSPQFTGVVRFQSQDLLKPHGRPRVWSIWNDLFHESITFDQLDAVFDVMFTAQDQVFLVLTKRIWRAFNYIKSLPAMARHLDTNFNHVYFGVTAGTQETLDDRLPILQRMKRKWGANTWLSVEPMLEPMDFSRLDGVDGVIFGGESGRHPRPTCMPWLKRGVDECQERGADVFVKQLGSRLGFRWTGKRSNGARLEEMPASLRVRDLPWEEKGE